VAVTVSVVPALYGGGGVTLYAMPVVSKSRIAGGVSTPCLHVPCTTVGATGATMVHDAPVKVTVYR
jgi:hypothetical protein